jgi:outer membrane autotransporter protein
MRVLASNATAAFGATAHRLDLISDKPNAPGGAWAEEFGVFHRSDASVDTVEVSGGGFGVAAGIDLLSTGNALIGAFAALESVEMEEENRTFAPLNVSHTSIGAYGGWINGPLTVNGAASFGVVDFTSDRRITVGDLTDRFRGEWSGSTYTGAIRAAYNVPLGWFDVKPFVAADYIGFKQDGYQETTAGLDDLALVVGDSDATLATASYGLTFESVLGADEAFAFRPHASLGYRHVLSWDNSPAAMSFAGNTTGTSFIMEPGVEPEDALVAGLGLNIDSQFVNIRVGYDAEVAENALTHYGSVTLRMAFW